MNRWIHPIVACLFALGAVAPAAAETGAEERDAQRGSRTGIESVQDLFSGSGGAAEGPAASRPRRPRSATATYLPHDPEARQMDVYRRSDRAFSQALSSHRRGDRAAAARGYQAALEIDPTFVEAMVNWARLDVESGDLERAESWLDRAVALRPDYPQIYAVRGVVSLRRGSIVHAIEDLDVAARMLPDDVEVLANLGAAYLHGGNVSKARKVLERALRLDPDDLDAIYNLALTEDLSRSPGRAEYHYQRFLRISSTSDASRADVIHRLEELGGTDSATAVSAPPPNQGPRAR